jgi:hypothetical protein
MIRNFLKIEKIDKPQNWKKRKEKNTLIKRYIYVCVCTLNKVWKNMIVKLMMFYCKTLLTPYVKNHNQHD